MAGDWIKMSTGLRTHPKVVRMASALKADRLRVIGGLWAVWSIFDAHSSDGLLEGYTLPVMDEELAWKGFSAAMASIGWLQATEDGLFVPSYEEHNGPTAKRRAQETARKAASRAESDDRTKSQRIADWAVEKSGQLSASDADKLRAREEKRRKEEETPDPLPGFSEFWSSWPKSSRKGGKAECEKLWRSQRLESVKTEIVEHVLAMSRTDGWTKQSGEFVPAPLVYLRGKRWDGAEVEGQQHGLALVGAV